MGYEIHGGPRHARFYCNTADVKFGSRFKSLDEAEAFLKWLGCDPRNVGGVLDQQLVIFRANPDAVSPFNVDAVYAAMTGDDTMLRLRNQSADFEADQRRKQREAKTNEEINRHVIRDHRVGRNETPDTF